MCEQLRMLMHHPALNATGQTHLGSLAALIERLHLFISNDIGPAHLAAALGTPSITIFGAARVEDWGTDDVARHRLLSVPVPCRPCYFSECPIGYVCLQGVKAGDVIRDASELLETT
jgi:ADP-heptose:LPS heptosyltransferase